MTDRVFEITGISLPEYKDGRIDYVSAIADTCAVSVEDADSDSFDSYIDLLAENAFALYSSYNIGKNKFATLTNGEAAVYMMYYTDIKRAVISIEKGGFLPENTSLENVSADESVIAWPCLKDYGMSYVIKLPDSRFIIIDGGFEFEEDADKLMALLRKLSGKEELTIASWIMTHPHIDHYRCFLAFHNKYSELVNYESFIYSFPAMTEEELRLNPIYETDKETEHLRLFEKTVLAISAPVIRPHTGQKMSIGGAVLEFLHTPDDYYKTPLDDINSISLVFKMYVSGQTALWMGDCDFEKTKLPQRWQTYLKSDILQIPHHGFCGGATSEGYDYIDPRICLHPDLERCFDKLGLGYDFNLHLYREMKVEALFVAGDKEDSICLPYTPSNEDKAHVIDRVELGLKRRKE